jgi:hypothetical protein
MDYEEDQPENGTEDKETSDDDLLKEAKCRYKEARARQSSWRQEARRCFDFRAGNQWSDEDKAILQEQMRMPTTFNRIDPYCRAVAGLEAGNRQQVRFIPREEGDVGVNELYTETVRWIRDMADAEYEEAEAFLDSFVSGIGCTETYMDYDEDPEGMVKIDHLDCLTEVVWDHNSRKRNLTDRKFDFRIKRNMSYSEIKDMFPEKADSITCTNEWDSTEEDVDPWDRNPETAYKKDGSDVDGRTNKTRKYTLVDYQYCEKESYYKVDDPISGQIVEMEEEQFNTINAKLQKVMGFTLNATKLRRIKWYRAFIVGGTVMEVSPAPCQESSTRKFITAYRDRNQNMWYGIVRAMIDPQEWQNKFFSQIINIINSNSKGGLLAEEGAFTNPRKAEEDWANPTAIVMLKAGGLAKIDQRQPAQLPASISQMMQFSIGAMTDVTGIPLELMGTVDRDQAGVLEAERKRTGITMLATLFDSFKQYRKDQGKLLLYFMKEYLSDGRLVRIMGESGQKYVPLIRQDDTIKFDVIVDDMPQSPNNKERVWGTMQVMLPILQSAGMPPEMLAEVVAYSPLPESFAQKLKQFMQQRNQQGPGPMDKAQLDKVAAEVYKTNADGGLAEAKAAGELAKAGLDAMTANQMAQQMIGMSPMPQMMPPGQPMQPPNQGMPPDMHQMPDGSMMPNNMMQPPPGMPMQ